VMLEIYTKGLAGFKDKKRPTVVIRLNAWLKQENIIPRELISK
jgi:hypothetical protein